MYEFNLIQILMIPHWIMSIIYFLTTVSFMYLKYMPLPVRISISIPIFITGLTFFFVDACGGDNPYGYNLLDIGNTTIMLSMFVNSFIFIHFKKKKE